jgi:hypothetical protein
MQGQRNDERHGKANEDAAFHEESSPAVARIA